MAAAAGRAHPAFRVTGAASASTGNIDGALGRAFEAVRLRVASGRLRRRQGRPDFRWLW